MAFTITTIVILLAALFGLLFKKNGELAGLGRESRRGGIRAPHGRLVRTKRLDAIEDAGFFEIFPRLALVLGIETLVVLSLCFVGLLSWEGMAAVSIHVLAVIATTVFVSYSETGVWQPLAYALVGYLVPGFALALLWAANVSLVLSWGASGVNAATMVLGMLGVALCVSWMPVVRTYAREFEDGYVNVIQVSRRSVACRAYEALSDDSWKPPADRIADPGRANDPRKYARGE